MICGTSLLNRNNTGGGVRSQPNDGQVVPVPGFAVPKRMHRDPHRRLGLHVPDVDRHSGGLHTAIDTMSGRQDDRIGDHGSPALILGTIRERRNDLDEIGYSDGYTTWPPTTAPATPALAASRPAENAMIISRLAHHDRELRSRVAPRGPPPSSGRSLSPPVRGTRGRRHRNF